MHESLWVMAGGATGALMRYQLGRLAFHMWGADYPYGTLLANVIGGFAMGVLVGVLARAGGSEAMRLLLAVGVLGGFTTFSAFSLEVVLMIERGAAMQAAGYIALSVLGAVIALFAGLSMVRALA